MPAALKTITRDGSHNRQCALTATATMTATLSLISRISAIRLVPSYGYHTACGFCVWFPTVAPWPYGHKVSVFFTRRRPEWTMDSLYA